MWTCRVQKHEPRESIEWSEMKRSVVWNGLFKHQVRKIVSKDGDKHCIHVFQIPEKEVKKIQNKGYS